MARIVLIGDMLSGRHHGPLTTPQLRSVRGLAVSRETSSGGRQLLAWAPGGRAKAGLWSGRRRAGEAA